MVAMRIAAQSRPRLRQWWRHSSTIEIAMLLSLAVVVRLPSFVLAQDILTTTATSSGTGIVIANPPPPSTTVIVSSSGGGSPTESNTQVCLLGAPAPRDKLQPPEFLTFRASPACALSVGCQRSFCTCLGVGFDSANAVCVPDATSSTSGGTSSSSMSSLSYPATCAAVERCHLDAILCFQQTAVLTSQAAECAPFSTRIYPQLIAAAAGAEDPLRESCNRFRCTHYNVTAHVLDAPAGLAFSRCFVNSSAAACPIPRSATLFAIVAAPDWRTVLPEDSSSSSSTAARMSVFSAALQQDVAEAVGTSARLSNFSLAVLTNETATGQGQRQQRQLLQQQQPPPPPQYLALVVELTVAVDTAVDFVNALLRGRGSSWLANARNAYTSYGGSGDFAVTMTPVSPFAPTPSPTAGTTTAAAETTTPVSDGNISSTAAPFDVDGASYQRVGDSEGVACGAACAVGITAAVLVILAVAVGIAYFVNHYTVQQRTSASSALDNAGETRGAEEDEFPSPSPQRARLGSMPGQGGGNEATPPWHGPKHPTGSGSGSGDSSDPMNNNSNGNNTGTAIAVAAGSGSVGGRPASAGRSPSGTSLPQQQQQQPQQPGKPPLFGRTPPPTQPLAGGVSSSARSRPVSATSATAAGGSGVPSLNPSRPTSAASDLRQQQQHLKYSTDASAEV